MARITKPGISRRAWHRGKITAISKHKEVGHSERVSIHFRFEDHPRDARSQMVDLALTLDEARVVVAEIGRVLYEIDSRAKQEGVTT